MSPGSMHGVTEPIPSTSLPETEQPTFCSMAVGETRKLAGIPCEDTARECCKTATAYSRGEHFVRSVENVGLT